MNAIAFNVLLCLFPLLLVLVAAAQRLVAGRRDGPGAAPPPRRAHPLRRRDDRRVAAADDPRWPAASRCSPSCSWSGAPRASSCRSRWRSTGCGAAAGPRSFWRSRLLAFALTVAGGALALLSVALTLLVRGFGREWPLVADSAAKAAALAPELGALPARVPPRSARPHRPGCGRAGRAVGRGAVGGLEVRLGLEPGAHAARRRSTARWRSRCRSCSGPTSRASCWSSGAAMAPGAPRGRELSPPAICLQAVELLAVAEGDQQVARLERRLRRGVEGHRPLRLLDGHDDDAELAADRARLDRAADEGAPRAHLDLLDLQLEVPGRGWPAR